MQGARGGSKRWQWQVRPEVAGGQASPGKINQDVGVIKRPEEGRWHRLQG